MTGPRDAQVEATQAGDSERKPSELPPEVLDEIAVNVANVRALFLAYVASGFTEDQAIHLLGCQLGAPAAPPKPRPGKSSRR